ncbi:heavy-metal-associated domain-containing protein [Roseisolibacter agri]|uniref:HMA domain-containing protein n=1 Tax=Roseisolibacter agri TaxID=2014610 RepID=A0AA37QDA8_9BACT|nr:cation transporter [Roseisolibacter agri]GLC28232.1 hypothetical protein rosag_47450 [Roseisolibacter agri]
METVKLAISGMTCGHCVSSVRQALETVPGLQVENVRIGAATVRLDGTTESATTEAALAAVQGAGYEASVDAPRAADASEDATAGCACCAPRAEVPTPLTSTRTATPSA